MITADELFGVIKSQLQQHWGTLEPNLITRTATTVKVFGVYTIQPTGDADFLVTSPTIDPHRFYFQSNALNWCILHHSNNTRLCLTLHNLDAQAMRTENEYQLHSQQATTATGDHYQLLQVKLQTDRDRLQRIRRQIREIAAHASKIQKHRAEQIALNRRQKINKKTRGTQHL